MGLLNRLKKKEGLPSDIDLDVPPEPPKMGIGGEISTEEPIDEELMIPKKKLTKPKPLKAKEKLAELPQLPEEEMFPEFPPLPEEEPSFGLKENEMGFPPPPEIKKEKKGLFSFLKPKKVAEDLQFPEMPPLPEGGNEFPGMPNLPNEGEKEFEMPPVPEEVPFSPQPVKPLKPIVKQPLPPIRKAVRKQKFITINDFQNMQDDINDIRSSLKDIDSFFAGLEENKSIRDKEYTEFHNDLQDINKKIMFVDKSLFKEAV